MVGDNASNIAEANAGNFPISSTANEESAGLGCSVDSKNNDVKSLLEYARGGDWQRMESFLRVNPCAINAKIGRRGFTALHAATEAGHVEIVKKLVELMSPEDLEIPNGWSLTALHSATAGGMTQIARCMVEKNPNLVEMADPIGYLPVTRACIYKRKEMSGYLLSKTPSQVLSQDNGAYGSEFLLASVKCHMLDIALQALARDDDLAAARFPAPSNLAGYNALLWSLSTTPEIFPSAVRLGFWRRWIYSCIPEPPISGDRVRDPSQWQFKQQRPAGNFFKLLGIIQICDLKMTHAYSSLLLDCVCQCLSKLNESQYHELGIKEAFIKAVELGMVEIVVKIIDIYPEFLVEGTESDESTESDEREIIVHSIINRQEKIFSLYYGLSTYHKAEKSNLMDRDGNTLLHFAGWLSPSPILARIPGAALQMQRELQWYEEVKSIVNPAYKFRENKTHETPDQVFTNSHRELVKEGERWMKDTATSYTVVGALIITTMFAAAFTVPGGNLDIGIPLFLHRTVFKIFIISDAISLCTSSTSVLMFLGVLTTRYAEQDFLKSLPTKLIIGLSTLFISIATMMIAFCAALVIMLDGMLELIIPVVLLACIPVTLYMFLQFPLLVDVVKSTYGPGIFDRKMKRWH